MRVRGSLGIGALSLALALPALAQSRDAAGAEVLFREGRELMKQGKYTEACPKLRASQELDPGVGTLLNLGDCYEKAGLVASAWATFVEAQGEAQKAGDTKRAKAAATRAEGLAQKLPKLVIDVPAASRVDGLVVRRGDVVVSASTFGSAIPVDPGALTITATAPGRAKWSKSVDVAGAATPTTIVVPALEPDVSPSAAEEPVKAPEVTVERRDTPVRTSSTQKTLGFVAMAVGVVGVGVGGYFGLSARSKWDDAKGHCRGGTSGCDAKGIDLGDQAGSAADLSTVAFIAGGALLAGGAILWLTAPSSKPERSPRVGLTLSGPSQLGVSVHGAY